MQNPACASTSSPRSGASPAAVGSGRSARRRARAAPHLLRAEAARLDQRGRSVHQGHVGVDEDRADLAGIIGAHHRLVAVPDRPRDLGVERHGRRAHQPRHRGAQVGQHPPGTPPAMPIPRSLTPTATSTRTPASGPPWVTPATREGELREDRLGGRADDAQVSSGAAGR